MSGWPSSEETAGGERHGICCGNAGSGLEISPWESDSDLRGERPNSMDQPDVLNFLFMLFRSMQARWQRER